MTSAEDSNSGCLSSLLHRLLCLGDNHRMPISNDTGNCNMHSDKRSSNHALDNAKTEEHAVKSSGTPSVVARLMGLDSLPSGNWVSNANFPDSFPRSKSVSFVEYLLEYDLTQPHHRRIRTSLSFREVPTSMGEESRDVAVLCRNNKDGSHRKTNTQSNSRRDKGTVELKQKKKHISKCKEHVRESEVGNKKLENQRTNLKFSKLKNEPRRVPGRNSAKVVSHDNGVRELSSASPVCKKYAWKNGDARSGSRTSPPSLRRENQSLCDPPSSRKRRNRRNEKKIVPENSHESSSPVTVLSVNDSQVHHQLHYPAKHSSINIVEAIKNGDQQDQGSVTDYCFELQQKLLNLTRKEIELTDWTSKNMLKAKLLDDVCVKHELEIFDLLLQDVVEELIMNSTTSCHLLV